MSNLRDYCFHVSTREEVIAVCKMLVEKGEPVTLGINTVAENGMCALVNSVINNSLYIRFRVVAITGTTEELGMWWFMQTDHPSKRLLSVGDL